MFPPPDHDLSPAGRLAREIRKACADDLRRWCRALLEADPEIAEALARAALNLEEKDRPPTRPSYTCPRCAAVSYNPTDIAERYCGRCHQFEAP